MRAFDKDAIPKLSESEKFDWSLTSDYVALEIGCGNGMHSIQWSKQNLDKTMIAIEQTKNKFAAFETKLGLHPALRNLFAVRADAIWWCANNLDSRWLDEIFILYPNPNPKASQSNKRFHNMPFMGFLLEHLRPEGRLTMATNVKSYAQEAKDQYVSIWNMNCLEESVWNITRGPRTAFEKKYLERGETCFNLVFSK